MDDVDKNAFIFGEDDKLTLVTGDQAFTQALVSADSYTFVTKWAGFHPMVSLFHCVTLHHILDY